MKPIPTLFIASMLTVSTQAQPTLTFGTNAPVTGTQYTLHYYGDVVPPGGAGDMQSWDLSGLGTDSMDVLQMVLPSTTPNGAEFPNATIAEISSPVTTYYEVTTDGIHFAGSDDGTSIIENAPMPKYLAFPCTMGTSWTAPHAAEFTYDGMTVFRSGTVTGEADGYGTVTMPWGTVSNALRIHLTNELQDSLELFTIAYTYDSYLYYIPGQSYPLAEIVTATVDLGFGTPQVTQFSRWTGEISTGVGAAITADDALRIHPNPVSDLVNIDLPADLGPNASVTITDAAGRTVHQQAIMPASGRTTRLDLSHLTPGMYTLSLTDDQGRRAASRLSKR